MTMTQAEYQAAKKLFETYETRKLFPNLTVDEAYEYQVGAKIRLERNALLRATDYTQLADSTPDSNDWLAYRMALRDIPQQPGFPFDVTFPTVPEPDVVGFEAFTYAGNGTRIQLDGTPLNPVQGPFALNGYYPLYRTQADANAAGDGDSHSHVINGNTYYMPDGVVQYHGSYNSY